MNKCMGKRVGKGCDARQADLPRACSGSRRGGDLAVELAKKAAVAIGALGEPCKALADFRAARAEGLRSLTSPATICD